jgi:hypothetical protein
VNPGIPRLGPRRQLGNWLVMSIRPLYLQVKDTIWQQEQGRGPSTVTAYADSMRVHAHTGSRWYARIAVFRCYTVPAVLVELFLVSLCFVDPGLRLMLGQAHNPSVPLFDHLLQVRPPQG